MKVLAILVVALVLVGAVCAYDPKYTGPAWQGKTAQDKQATLNAELKKDQRSYGWYSIIHLGEIFIEGMSKTFDFFGDDMPDQGLFNAEQRPKLIHSVGAVAEARWVSNGRTNYTGIFRGADDCFVRFSLAAEPEYKTPLTIPGISVKCMRNGQPSANVFAMYSTNGQSSFNFFEHDFTNHAPEFDVSKVSLANRQLYEKFLEASKWPTFLGLNGLSTYDSNGNAERNPVFPFRLVFHPSTDLHYKFSPDPVKGDEYFLDQLAQVPPGVVYTIYAEREPNTLLEEVGQLVLTETPVASRWGDKDMFFQHTRMEDDVAMRPEWGPEIDAIIAQQKATYPFFFYPDLPFN